MPSPNSTDSVNTFLKILFIPKAGYWLMRSSWKPGTPMYAYNQLSHKHLLGMKNLPVKLNITLMHISHKFTFIKQQTAFDVE